MRLYIPIFIIAVFLFSSRVAEAGLIVRPPLGAGLVGYWSFDQIVGTKVYDWSSERIHGFIAGNPIRTSGKILQGLDFDGTDDEVNLGNPSALQISGSMSVAIWANRETNPTNVTNMLSKRTSGAPGTRQFYLHVSDANPDKVQFAVTNSDTDYTATSITTMPASTWIHAVGVYDSVARTVKIYINGVLEATAAGPASITVQNAIDAAIGSRGGAATNLFTGILDEARVYNRALSSQEVKRLYNLSRTIRSGIQFDKSSSANAATANSITFTHVVDKGLRNRLLVVGVADQDGTAADRVISSITANGRALTSIRSDIASNGVQTEVWYLSNPSGGTNTITVTFAGTVSSITAGAASFSGVDQDNPIEVNNGANGSTVAPIVSLTTVNPYAWVVDVLGFDSATLPRVATSTGRFQTWHNVSGTSVSGVSSAKKQVYPAGDINMIWALNASAAWALSAASLKPATTTSALNISPAGGTLGNGLVGYWSFNGSDLSGITAADASGNGKHGTLVNAPAAQIGKVGQGLLFDGDDTYVSVGNVGNGLQSVTFWMKATTTTQKIIDLNGTATIEVVNGTVTANSFTSPTIYVDGVITSTIADTEWHHVAVTTESAINASAVDIGRIGSQYFGGVLDEVRLYNRALLAGEVKRLYNVGR